MTSRDTTPGRYRGVDRRSPAPAAESLDVLRVVAGLVVVAVGALGLTQVLDPTLVDALGRVALPAGCLAVVAGAAMFIRWRIDGRAQSWWLALGYLIVGVAGLVDPPDQTPAPSLYVSVLVVTFGYFAAACRSPQVDSILSVRRAAFAVVGGVVALGIVEAGLSSSVVATRVTAAVLAALFATLAVLWQRCAQDKPWFVVPLVGFAMCCVIFAVVADPAVAGAQVACLLLVLNGVVVATTLAGLQATATGHRALALDAQRERDLVNSMRDELEARFAETLHEVRSTVLALEGGIQLLRPETGPESVSVSLTDSLVSELKRLRTITDPDRAAVPEDFQLVKALESVLELSRASGWNVSWDVGKEIFVRGRPDDVAQIIHALLSNASKYAPEGPVDVSALRAGKFVLVMVDDYGPGVRPANRERIFERGERPDQQQSDGQGLGLHIGRGLARALGGELWVEQHPRGGARFVLALRVAVTPDDAMHTSYAQRNLM